MTRSKKTSETRMFLLRTFPALLAGIALAAPALGAIEFEDVSESAGLSGGSESWGASWGDINGDNWPDLFHNGHRDYPRFYRNTGEGSFQDIAYEIDPGNWIAFPGDDKHGASFIDFDNDGDEDLHISVSETGPAQLLVNNGDFFVERASESELGNDDQARHGIFFDLTQDGHLDVVQLNRVNLKLSVRDPDDADNPEADFDRLFNTGLLCPGQNNYGHLIDLNDDNSLEFICAEEGQFPLRVFDVSSIPVSDLTFTVPFFGNVNNSVVADFNGDLRNDIVMTRGAMRPSHARIVAGNRRLEAWFAKNEGFSGKGFDFVSDGEITVGIDHRGMKVVEKTKTYVLSPDGQTVGDAGPVSVRYDAAEEVWKFRFDEENEMQAYVQIDSVAPISGLVVHELDPPETPRQTAYLESTPNGLVRNYTSGLWTLKYCGGIAAGDFDNDMDVDLYLVCRRGASNLTNRIYENQGDGTFVLLTNHGAEGPVGTGFQYGVGDSAVLADYDVDGFLDIFVTNGLLFYPLNVGGPDTLLRNKGNGNHWIQLDLAGVASNRDAVGAKVYVTAGGVTQLREQNGGYTRWSQNHQRIHFGLGSNDTVELLRIEWPSGQVDEYTNVPADVLYDAEEGGSLPNLLGSLTPATLGPPVYTTLEPGDECGEPPYNLDYGPAVLFWKNCDTGVWSLRAKGGRFDQFIQYTAGTILADAPFSGITPVNLGGATFDQVGNETPEELRFAVGAWFSNSKGFDFRTDGQTQACLDFGVQQIPTLIVGGRKKQFPVPFDLIDFGAPCSLPPQCGDPRVDSAVDYGVFIWRDCAYFGAGDRWYVTIAGGGNAREPYTGMLISDAVLSPVPNSVERGDRLDSIPGDTAIDFVLNVGKIYFDEFQVTIPAGSTSCFIGENLPGYIPVYLGGERMPMGGNFDLESQGACSLPIPPTPAPECGQPNFDNGGYGGVFVWRDCAAAGPNGEWSVRATGAGRWQVQRYTGDLSSVSETLDPTPVALEPSDIFDTLPGDGTVDFDFREAGVNVDGFDITLPPDADACLALSLLPGGAQIELGKGNEIMGNPFDLNTLGACN